MKAFFIILFCAVVWTAKAQDPVKLSYLTKKIGDKKYEIVIEAKLDDGWHLYSQTQPKTAIAVPTTIKFNKNPLIVVTGKTTESGNLEKYKEPTLGIEAWQYSGSVQFIQPVTMKVNAKTNLAGTITYQVCTDKRCLPAKTVSFSVAIL